MPPTIDQNSIPNPQKAPQYNSKQIFRQGYSSMNPPRRTKTHLFQWISRNELPQTQSTGQGLKPPSSILLQNKIRQLSQQDNTDSIPEQNSVNAPEEQSFHVNSFRRYNVNNWIDSETGTLSRECPAGLLALVGPSEVVVPRPKSTAANENAAEDLQNPPKQTDSPNPFLDAPKSRLIQHQEDNTTTDVDEPQLPRSPRRARTINHSRTETS
ncbi:hypothetical protein CJJ09_000998 [Candidozyma auris]|nr:hypothetical protein CJJ09_000998 [[Candida] auris]